MAGTAYSGHEVTLFRMFQTLPGRLRPYPTFSSLYNRNPQYPAVQAQIKVTTYHLGRETKNFPSRCAAWNIGAPAWVFLNFDQDSSSHQSCLKDSSKVFGPVTEENNHILHQTKAMPWSP